MLRILLIALTTIVFLQSNAQDFSFGKISKEEFQKGNYAAQGKPSYCKNLADQELSIMK